MYKGWQGDDDEVDQSGDAALLVLVALIIVVFTITLYLNYSPLPFAEQTKALGL